LKETIEAMGIEMKGIDELKERCRELQIGLDKKATAHDLLKANQQIGMLDMSLML
jgi:hypothetical protein